MNPIADSNVPTKNAQLQENAVSNKTVTDPVSPAQKLHKDQTKPYALQKLKFAFPENARVASACTTNLNLAFARRKTRTTKTFTVTRVVKKEGIPTLVEALETICGRVNSEM